MCARGRSFLLVPACVAALLALEGLAPAADPHDAPLPGSAVIGRLDVTGVETGFGPLPIFNHKGPGADFVEAGVTTRRQVTHKGQPGQVEPFVLFVPPLPPGAQLVSVILNWNWLLNGPAPAADTILVNGAPVTGTLCGTGTPDLCWGKDGGASYVALPGDQDLPLFHGTFNEVALATDKPLGADPRAYGEGLSVLCVYEIPGTAPRNVDVYCGYSSTESDPTRTGTARAPMTFSNAYIGGPLHFFLNALDGQQETLDCPGFRDDFFIDGVLVSGLVLGTGSPGDAWQGFLGPNGISDLYDHANDDLGLLGIVPAGAGGLTATTTRPDTGDCIGHSFGAVAFEIEEPTPTWECWSPGKACADGIVPELKCDGDLSCDSLNTLEVCNAPPNAPLFLVIGFTPLRAPFKGGILGPSPDLILPFTTDAAGSFTLPFVWPCGVPAGVCLWFQFWIQESGGGFCATKTVKGTTN